MALNRSEGWIKLHRGLIDNDIFRYDLTAWRVFEVLLLIVDHSGNNRGKWRGGRKRLAELCGINESTVYKALVRLGPDGAKMVTTENHGRYGLYRVNNWDKWQGDKPSGNSKVTAQEQHGNSQVTLIEEDKNVNNEENSSNELLAEPVRMGKAEINKMFDEWREITGLSIQSKIKANRYACSNLLKKHGEARLQKLMRMVAAAQESEYAPRISDFSELQSKTNELLVWVKGRAAGENNSTMGVL